MTSPWWHSARTVAFDSLSNGVIHRQTCTQGLTAGGPSPPEEQKKVKTAIGASRAKQSREDYVD